MTIILLEFVHTPKYICIYIYMYIYMYFTKPDTTHAFCTPCMKTRQGRPNAQMQIHSQFSIAHSIGIPRLHMGSCLFFGNSEVHKYHLEHHLSII